MEDCVCREHWVGRDMVDRSRVKMSTRKPYIGNFLHDLILQNVPEHIHARLRFEGHAGLHAVCVDEADQFLWAGGTMRVPVLGCAGRDTVDRGFVVETIEIGAGGGKGADPAMWLLGCRSVGSVYH